MTGPKLHMTPPASVMHWSLFGAFHDEARRLRMGNRATLNTRSVAAEQIRKVLEHNLAAEGWKAERAALEPD